MPALWKIDRDYIYDPEIDGRWGGKTAAGRVRSRSWDKYPERQKDATMRFRMLDDDGNIYYGGRCTPDTEFEPLWDFGMPNAGAVTIQFKENGKWVTL